MKNYKLTVTAEQAEVLVKALDLYFRIGIGQIEEVDSVYRWDVRGRRIDDTHTESGEIDHRAVQYHLDEVKKLLGHPPNGSWGIHSPAVPDKYRVAWDLEKVIRHRLAWDRTPEGGFGVDFDQPTQSSALELARIESHEGGSKAMKEDRKP